MYKKLNEMLAEGYLETKLQDEVAHSLGVNEATDENVIGVEVNNAKDGVYIYSTDGKLYDIFKWNYGSKDAVGVALINKKCKFVIAPDTFNNLTWGKPILVTDCFVSDDLQKAEKDFGGISNTKHIIQANKGQRYIGVTFCSKYRFKNGKYGYLGSLGEYKTIYDNHILIDIAFERIGGDKFWGCSRILLTSSQFDDQNAWYMDTSNGKIFHYPKTGRTTLYGVRPLCQL